MFTNNWQSTPTKIAWDLGDTLVRIKGSKLQEGAVRASVNFGISISKQQLADAIKAEWSIRHDRYSLNIISQIDSDERESDYWIKDFYPCVLGRLGHQKAISTQLLDFFCNLQMNPASFEMMPYAKEVLNSLWNAGIEQCILSNAFPSAKRIITYHKLDKYLKFILLSYEHKLAKPDPRIFYLLEKKFSLAAEEYIIFIDDRTEFLAIPDGFKLLPVWLNNNPYQNTNWRGSSVQSIKEVLKYFLFDSASMQTSHQPIFQEYLFV
jgi:FMN phosphatase YigB (HAD superfamily)